MNYEYYIYITTNSINGKNYVGKHYGEFNDKYKGSGVLITKAFEKYGIENFSKEIIAVCNSLFELNILETIYISIYINLSVKQNIILLLVVMVVI